jgi:hypothetical protein
MVSWNVRGIVGVMILMLASLVAMSASARAGSAVIGGVRMNCYAADVVVSDKVPGPGFAVAGAILFSPRFLSEYPPTVQRLVFLHECGHQYVGVDESAADCWAVSRAKRQGWLTHAGLGQACRAIIHTEGDGAHLAGPERCQALRQCFENAEGPRISSRPAVRAKAGKPKRRAAAP